MLFFCLFPPTFHTGINSNDVFIFIILEFLFDLSFIAVQLRCHTFWFPIQNRSGNTIVENHVMESTVRLLPMLHPYVPCNILCLRSKSFAWTKEFTWHHFPLSQSLSKSCGALFGIMMKYSTFGGIGLLDWPEFLGIFFWRNH